MKEKILALLIAKFAGVRKDGLNQLAGAIALQVTTEEEAQTAVGKFTADQVSAFVSEWRKEADAEITKANKTYEDGLKKKYDFVEKASEQTPLAEKTKPDDIDAKIAAAVSAAINPLQTKLSAYETKEQQAIRQNIILTKAKDLGIPEWRIQEGFTIADDADEAAINTTLSAIKQNIVTAGLEKSPGFPIDPKVKPSTEELDSILGKM